ncbi:MAG: prepilin peptidase [Pseudomonadota bacterium]
MLLTLLACLALGLCAYAALRDVVTLIIPNWLNAAILVSGCLALMVAGLGWDAISEHLLAGLVAFAVSAAMFYAGLWGGGDAKMVPGVMVWLGPAAAFDFVFGMAIVGGGLALVLILVRALTPATGPHTQIRSLRRGQGVPYGVAILGGLVFAMGTSPLFGPVASRVPFLN